MILLPHFYTPKTQVIAKPLGNEDRKRLEALGFTVESYEAFVQTFICTPRHSGTTAKDGRFHAGFVPSRPNPLWQPKTYQDRNGASSFSRIIPINHCRLTKSLNGDYNTWLHPDYFGRQVQSYFVVRIQADQSLDSLWRQRHTQYQRYLAIIELLGVPGAVFSQPQDDAPGEFALDLYYFLSKTVTAEHSETVRGENIPLGADLIERVVELHASRKPRLDFYNPLEAPQKYAGYIEVVDAENMRITRIEGSRELTLEAAIRQSLRDMSRRDPGSPGVHLRRLRRDGIVPLVESLLMKKKIGLRTARIQVLPSETTPADIALIPGSRLLHPLTLEPLADTPGEAMQALLMAAPRRVDPDELMAAAESREPPSLREKPWRPDGDLSPLGLLPFVIRREWSRGTGRTKAVECVVAWHTEQRGRNPWWDSGLPSGGDKLRELVDKLYAQWGEFRIEMDEFSAPEELDVAGPVKIPRQRTYKDHLPPEDWGLPLSQVKMILDIGMHDNKNPAFMNFLAETMYFKTWELFEWASEERDPPMLHSTAIDGLPGFCRLNGVAKQDALRKMGIERLEGRADRDRAIAHRYMRRRDSYPVNAPRSEPRIPSIDVGIRLLMTDEEIRTRYSRTHAKNIIATVIPPELVGAV